MKISTEINSASRRVGQAKAIELVAKAGFDHFDFSMFEMAKVHWESKRFWTTILLLPAVNI
ncbi:MAG: hypothetical protein E7462_04855 [Ruminococcaceae bacterium]|nr:hypothetical protein [Oscillospiraceae bacterium]